MLVPAEFTLAANAPIPFVTSAPEVVGSPVPLAFPAIYAFPAASTATAAPDVKTELRKQELPGCPPSSQPGTGPISAPAYTIRLPAGSILAKNAPEIC